MYGSSDYTIARQGQEGVFQPVRATGVVAIGVLANAGC